MKKQLLGTSAIVAASLGMSAVAMAQAPAAPQPVTITINGYSGQYIGWASQDDVGSSAARTIPSGGGLLNNNCTNCSRTDGFDMIADQRLNLQGRANLGDGMTVGVQLEINGSQSGSANYSHNRAGNVYLDFATFGRITLGTQTMMARSMISNSYTTGNPFSFGSPLDVFGRSGMVDGGAMHSLLINPTGSSATNATFNGVGGDMVGDAYTNKIQYLTPRLFGFQLGLGWAPENSKDFTGGGEVVNKDGGRATHRNGVSAAVNYIQNFGGIDVAAGAGYITWLDTPNKSLAGMAVDANTQDGLARHRVQSPQQFLAGAAVHYAGFKVGVGYGRIDNGRALQTNLTEFTGAQQFRASALNDSLINLRGDAWSFGGSYTFGPASISLNYTTANNNDCPVQTLLAANSCTGADKFSGIGAGGTYVIGSGVALTLGGFYGKYRGNNYNNGLIVNTAQTLSATNSSLTNASQNNEGGGIIGGLLIRF